MKLLDRCNTEKTVWYLQDLFTFTFFSAIAEVPHVQMQSKLTDNVLCENGKIDGEKQKQLYVYLLTANFFLLVILNLTSTIGVIFLKTSHEI